MREYTTIIADKDIHLDFTVTEMLNNGTGWELQGGVAVCSYLSSDGFNNPQFFYAQALVREMPDDADKTKK